MQVSGVLTTRLSSVHRSRVTWLHLSPNQPKSGSTAPLLIFPSSLEF